MQRLKVKRLLFCGLLFFLTGVVSFFICAANDEGAFDHKLIVHIATWILWFFCYPAYLFSTQDPLNFILCGFAGIILNSFIAEFMTVIYYNYKSKLRQNNSTPNN